MGKLYIHIGAKKTGSTTLQAVLKGNQKMLADHGYFVSKAAGAIEDKAFSGFYLGEADRLPAMQAWLAECAEAMQAGCKAAIITAESLSDLRLEEIQKLHDDLVPRFDGIEIIYYIRRQDLMAVSHFSTSLKGGGVTKALMSTQMGARGRRGFNFDRVAEDWEAVFGASSMCLRKYADPGQKGWDIVEDFCTLIGIDFHSELHRKENKNVRLTRNQAAYLRLYNIWAREGRVRHSQEARTKLVNALSDLPDDTRIPLPSQEEAKEFYKIFKGGNKRIRLKYFPESDALFSKNFSMYPDATEDISQYAKDDVLEDTVRRVGLVQDD